MTDQETSDLERGIGGSHVIPLEKFPSAMETLGHSPTHQTCIGHLGFLFLMLSHSDCAFLGF